MKRIDAIIQEDKLDVVTDALKEIGITGITITQSRGIGTGERPVLRGGKRHSKVCCHVQ
ncbi:MAG: P-II family nitrogen regulator [Candidatus Nitrosotenuis sp.]